MIDHKALRLGIRAQASAIAALADTGFVALGTTTSAYTRASGSFITDGFEPGMEVTASGWSGGDSGNNGTSTVVEVQALTLTVNRALTATTAGGFCNLTVGIPAHAADENVEFDPPTGSPWIEEEFVSGPQRVLTAPASSGTIEYDPLVHLHVHVPENTGPEAVESYADALLQVFRPNTAITLSDGKVVRVRTDAAVYRGPIRRNREGFSTVRVSVPLRMHYVNA